MRVSPKGFELLGCVLRCLVGCCRLVAFGLGLPLFTLLVFHGEVRATTLDVCPSGCSYSSIQTAIDAAVAGDLITVAAGTYTEDLTVAKSIEIEGVDSTTTTIVGSITAITVAYGVTVEIRQLKIQGSPNTFTPFGAGVYNQGDLTIRNAVVTGGFASQAGGGIYTTGDLLLDGVTVSDNTADPANTVEGWGGGLYIANSLITPVVRIYNSVFDGNEARFGGGIYNSTDGHLYIDGSEITGNRVYMGNDPGVGGQGRGGGIRTFGKMVITDSEIRSNSSDLHGGGISINCTDEDVTIANSVISDNTANESISLQGYGGGVHVSATNETIIIGTEMTGNDGLSGSALGIEMWGTVRMIQCTVNDNRRVAILNYGGTLNIKTSTISGNDDDGVAYPAGSFGASDTTLEYVTITENGGHGILAGQTVTVGNSIVAGNTGPLTYPYPGGSVYSDVDCWGPINTLGHNLVGNIASGAICSGWSSPLGDIKGGGAAPVVDPLLGPLQDNGGLRSTHALLAGSPAIDAGNACGRFDQRGLDRPADGGTGSSICDIGSYEANALCGTPRVARVISPTDASTGVELEPLLEWTAVSAVVSYDILISASTPATLANALETATGLTRTHYIPNTALAAGTTYYWRVRTNNDCGNRIRSAEFSFTTQ